MPHKVLITGATGNIGSQLARSLLAGSDGDDVVLLVRGRSGHDALRRALEHVRGHLDPSDSEPAFRHLQVLAGDITKAHLGLDRDVYDALSRSLTHIVHSAASTCFTLPLEAARAINVGGTANVMKLAQACLKHGGLKCVAHISTAYVNGPSPLPIGENALERRCTFSNTYERTKWESEGLVRALADELPLLVLRPSTVVGDSRTGHTSSFNVLYAPLRLIAGGLVQLLPGDRRTVLDVVPSDYVARAIRHVLCSPVPPIGRTLHLVAGYERSLTIGAIVDTARRMFHVDRHARPVRWVAPHLLAAIPPSSGGNDARINQVLAVFSPFMTARRDFDASNAHAALEGSGIGCPEFARYIETCLAYCVRTDWGRRPAFHGERSCARESRRAVEFRLRQWQEPRPAPCA
jgi:thioester reductase-like protein